MSCLIFNALFYYGDPIETSNWARIPSLSVYIVYQGIFSELGGSNECRIAANNGRPILTLSSRDMVLKFIDCLTI